jgi:transposase
MGSRWEESRSRDLITFKMDLLTQAQRMTPEAVAALLRRNHELECESKVRRKEAKLLRDELASRGDKVSALNEKLTGADAEAEQLKAETEQLKVETERLKAETERLKAKLAWFEKQLFGAKSERRILEALSPSDQLWLGEQMLKMPEDPPADDETVADIEAKSRPKKKRLKPDRSEDSVGSRLQFDDSVPVEEVTIKDPELEALPKDQVEIIGQDVTYKLGQRSPYFVIKTVRTAWRRKSEETINKATLPIVVERSIADVSFLAGLAVDKICHHLPLYRQHQRLEQAGIHIDRSTLTRLYLRVAEMCDMTYQAQLSSILMSKVITMDESPTPAGRMGGKMKKGYYWVLYGDKGEVVFVYSPTRSRKVIDKLLEGFKGTLHSDGYRAYESFCRKTQGVFWAGCWAHTRRKFIDAERKEPDKVKKILEEFQKLYEIEARGRGKPKALERLRDIESRRIVDRLFVYFKDELAESTLLPSNKFIEALEYAIKHETPLRVFLDNPEVAIDTNHVERQIRYAVMGRKNWMFHWTENGARHSGILYSLLLTCQLQGVDPRAYLIDILQRMDTHPGTDAYQLTPRNWMATTAGAPMRSVADK